MKLYHFRFQNFLNWPSQLRERNASSYPIKTLYFHNEGTKLSIFSLWNICWPYYLALRLPSFASTHQALKYLNTTQNVLIICALSYIVCFLTTVSQNQVLTAVLYRTGVFDTTTKSMKRFNNNMHVTHEIKQAWCL